MFDTSKTFTLSYFSSSFLIVLFLYRTWKVIQANQAKKSERERETSFRMQDKAKRAIWPANNKVKQCSFRLTLDTRTSSSSSSSSCSCSSLPLLFLLCLNRQIKQLNTSVIIIISITFVIRISFKLFTITLTTKWVSFFLSFLFNLIFKSTFLFSLFTELNNNNKQVYSRLWFCAFFNF